VATKPRSFNPEHYYHIYNRGVEGRNVFTTDQDYQRFLETIDFYLYEQNISYTQFQNLYPAARQAYSRLNPKGLETLRVKLIAYCLMPNHFHLLLKPAEKNGLTRFASDISNSYTRYFNIKNERLGNLFQGTFKDKEISSEESLLQVSRYIHLNPISSSRTNPGKTLKLGDYPFSSYQDWINPTPLNPKGLDLDYKEIRNCIKFMGKARNYKEFVESKIDKDPKIEIGDLSID